MERKTKETIIKILAEQSLIDINDIRLDSTPEELGLDSLNLVEIIFSLEETFDISIPFNANDASDQKFVMADVNSLIKSIESLISAKG